MIQPGVNPGLPATLSETTHKQPALCQLVPLRPGKVGGFYGFHLYRVIILGRCRLFLISNSFSNTVTRGIKSDMERNANLIATLAEAEMMEEEELLNKDW